MKEFEKYKLCADFIKDLRNVDMAVWSKEQIINTCLHKLGIREDKFFTIVPSPRDVQHKVMLEIFDMLYPDWRGPEGYDKCIEKVAGDIKKLISD